METKTTQENSEACAGLAAATGSAFPRNPERDAEGNAVLYPGMKRYEGVAASFSDPQMGEVVVLAPNSKSLKAYTEKFGLTSEFDDLDPKKCRAARLESMPHAALSESAREERKK